MYEDIEDALPMRLKAVHCVVNQWVKAGFEHHMSMFGSHFRTRVRYYDRSNMDENLVELATCGIPFQFMPQELDGPLELNNQEWLHNKFFNDLDAAGIPAEVEVSDFTEFLPQRFLTLIGFLCTCDNKESSEHGQY